LPQETIFNQIPKFKTATNPTDIIWENRHIKGSKKKVNQYLGVFAIFILLVLSFSLIWALKSRQMKYIKEHSIVDCKSIKKIYWMDNESKKLQYAFREYMIDYEQ